MQFVSDHFSELYGLRPGWLFSPESLNVIKPFSLSFCISMINVLTWIDDLYFLCIPFQDASDAQWRNFRSNLPILTVVFTLFAVFANRFRTFFHLKARGMSIIWLFISFIYLFYLHGAWYVFFVISFTIIYLFIYWLLLILFFYSLSCSVIFILSIASLNFLLVKVSFIRMQLHLFLSKNFCFSSSE